MRLRIIACIVFLSLAWPAFSQSLSFRKEDGSYLQIATKFQYDYSAINLLKDLSERTGVALAYVLDKNTDEKQYFVSFLLETEKRFSFHASSKLLIKTFKGSNIILKELLEGGDALSMNINHAASVIKYSIIPCYKINLDDLQLIMNEGIAKMQFMTTAGAYIRHYDKEDLLGEKLLQEYKFLEKKSDFESGF